ncbi:unnamed protein product [Didymodactylos carnosus]|uniref:Uncharacterized protein n=1 Tax=Didymodactylos carnosus TaxID=1234261 RepID=A0A815QZ15_9BILA|nr:unnamed protein product [Didymodactylos carnosus]CAF1469871.1 unnamed protein product [Didymodactylos carnosus]CAF4252058.1 unnamed protein product [Didymodactylos carnosus]CAF4337930.1 unnamed protein product [Didymodactylos carnosus]
MPKGSKTVSHCKSVCKSGNISRWSRENLTNTNKPSSDEEYFMGMSDDDSLDFIEQIRLSDVGDLFEVCKEKLEPRNISVVLYLILKFFWEEYFSQIGATTCKTFHT